MSMALHIQDPETDRLARELSAVTGQTIAQVVNTALRERQKSISLERSRTKDEIIARIEAITDRLAKLQVLDNRTPDEIIGYNERGYFD